MVKLTVEDFGVYNQEKVKKFTWTTSSGFSVSVISYGAIVQAIVTPDRNGDLKDVVLGFDDLESYVNKNTPHFGSTVGRCANRIANAEFMIDDHKYKLAKNVGEPREHHLHGGIIGFDQKVWDYVVVNDKVVFSYLSKDLEEGYPGDLITNVSYLVTDGNSLYIEYTAATTKKTVVNLTNHSYFNLAGHDAGAEELYNHIVKINADRITETDSNSIPTGKLLDVKGTPFNLRIPKRLGDVMSGNRFDDNFCVNTDADNEICFASSAFHPLSGRNLEISTDQPGIQFYTSNFLPSPNEPALIGKSSVGYRRHGAFCFETQKYPDAIHHQNFKTAVLTPGEVYKHRVNYKFWACKSSEPRVVSV